MPQDERNDTLPNYLYREESAILIEPTVPINIGTKESQHILKVATYLMESEREEFLQFFRDKKIIFSWSYTNMLGLHPNHIMHHLSINPGIKLIM